MAIKLDFFLYSSINSTIKSHMKILQMNLISLLKQHQSIDVTVSAIPLFNFLTIIRFRTHVIPLVQLAKLINHHIALIRVMHTH